MKPRRSNPRGQGDLLRRDLLAATRRLADRLGSTDKLSIRAIAREVRVAAPSVYLHFRNRDEIFQAAVAEDYAALAAHLRVAAAQAGDAPIERLRAIGLAYCSFAVEDPGSYRMITEVQQSQSKRKGNHTTHPAAEVQALLLDAIMDCQRAGFGSGVDPDLILACLWSAWHGFIELRRSKPKREWPATAEVVDLTTNSLLVQGSATDNRKG